MAQSQDLHEQEMKEAAAKGQASPASMANQDTAVSGTKEVTAEKPLSMMNGDMHKRPLIQEGDETTSSAILEDASGQHHPEDEMVETDGGNHDGQDYEEALPQECVDAAAEASFVHPADLADHLENLDLESQVCALRRMNREDAAEALAEMDENAVVDVLENLDAGDYVITEITAPAGYILDDTPHTISVVPGETYTLTFENTRLPGLLITKVDSDTGEALQGAVFKVTRGDGSVVRENAVTDAYGLIHLPELETGTYIITEIKAPDGYVIDETPKTVELREGQTYEVTFSNTKRSRLTIKKIDEDTRQPLKNAVFSISKANGEIVNERAETDANGVITLTGLPDCTLVVTEIEAPDGYILQDMPKTIEVRAGGNYELTFTNKRAYGLQIRKIIKGTNQPLDGCRFTVEKANGEMVGTYTTDSSGIATVTGLEDGVYVVTEISCPEGYHLDPTPQNVIVKAGELATVTFENEKLAGVRIKKIDAVTGEGIYGVRFLIKDAHNNLLGEYSTDQDGYIELDELLTDGKSEIKIKVEEIAAAEGYVLDDTVRTLRIRRGETTELVVENTPILGQIQVVKKSAQDNPVTNQPKGSLLEGAVFEITNADTGRVVDTMTSDSRGIAASNPIPLGRYYVQEVQRWKATWFRSRCTMMLRISTPASKRPATIRWMRAPICAMISRTSLITRMCRWTISSGMTAFRRTPSAQRRSRPAPTMPASGIRSPIRPM